MDNSPRAGKNHRINQNRSFHVMGQGWFVLTREGVDGPYVDKNKMDDRIRKFTDTEKSETPPDEPAPWEEFFLR